MAKDETAKDQARVECPGKTTLAGAFMTPVLYLWGMKKDTIGDKGLQKGGRD